MGKTFVFNGDADGLCALQQLHLHEGVDGATHEVVTVQIVEAAGDTYELAFRATPGAGTFTPIGPVTVNADASLLDDDLQAAFTAAVLLGITISAIGVRALELFVDPAVFAALTSAQRTVFRVIDVVLTGAVLGGGADGMHKLVSVFTNFMDRTNANLKGGTP